MTTLDALEWRTDLTIGDSAFDTAPSTVYTPTVTVKNRTVSMFDYLCQEQGVIRMTGSVDELMYDQVTGQLVLLKILKKKRASMVICSGGGSIIHGNAILDCMSLLGMPVSTKVTGIAASMAAVILACGTPGLRFAYPSARIMIHQPRTIGGGGGVRTADDIDIDNDEMQFTKRRLIQRLADASGKSFEEVEADCKHDNWLAPEECLPEKTARALGYPKWYGPKGLIDHIYDPRKAVIVSPDQDSADIDVPYSVN
jgi:ATP-dependent Clp protease protease subunit